jgi:hypothetical protein
LRVGQKCLVSGSGRLADASAIPRDIGAPAGSAALMCFMVPLRPWCTFRNESEFLPGGPFPIHSKLWRTFTRGRTLGDRPVNVGGSRDDKFAKR